jgi:hypothetical protein
VNPTSGRRDRRAPLTEAIAVAIAGLVDDGQDEVKREPTHFDLDQWVRRFGLAGGDPKSSGAPVGKRKRVLGALRWASEHDLASGERAVVALIDVVRGRGGFRPESTNYVGQEALANARATFETEGFVLGSDGELRPAVLESLSGAALTTALRSYVRRAKAGVEDAALLVGTGKDLLEAAAKHVLQVKYNADPTSANFPTLLGQAFNAVGLCTPHHPRVAGEAAQCDVDRALFELGCAVNRLRNKEGTGHGRPWITSVNAAEARVAVEAIGIVAERLLEALEGTLS